MQQLTSFLSGTWQSGRGRSRLIHHAISGEALWEVTSEGLDMAAARQFAIEKGAPALRAMTFIERAAMLKAVAKHLLSDPLIERRWICRAPCTDLKVRRGSAY